MRARLAEDGWLFPRGEEAQPELTEPGEPEPVVGVGVLLIGDAASRGPGNRGNPTRVRFTGSLGAVGLPRSVRANRPGVAPGPGSAGSPPIR